MRGIITEVIRIDKALLETRLTFFKSAMGKAPSGIRVHPDAMSALGFAYASEFAKTVAQREEEGEDKPFYNALFGIRLIVDDTLAVTKILFEVEA